LSHKKPKSEKITGEIFEQFNIFGIFKPKRKPPTTREGGIFSMTV